MEVTTEDGYVGILRLDHTSVQVTTDGYATKTSIAARGLGLLRGLFAAEDGGVGDHGAVGLGHLAGVAGADGVAGSVPAAGGPGIAGGGGVTGDRVALAVHIGGLETSDTNNLETILQRLDAEMEVTTEDGYVGILRLDHTSVQARRKRQDSLTSLLLLFPRHPLRWAAVGALFPPFSGFAAQL